MICGGVETDEEEEVGREKCTSKDGGKFLAGTVSMVKKPREVVRSEVSGTSAGVEGEEERVSCKVDKEEVDYELDDLDSGYPFLPPDADATGGLEIVPVHDDVNSQVESDWHVALSRQQNFLNEKHTTDV